MGVATLDPSYVAALTFHISFAHIIPGVSRLCHGLRTLHFHYAVRDALRKRHAGLYTLGKSDQTIPAIAVLARKLLGAAGKNLRCFAIATGRKAFLFHGDQVTIAIKSRLLYPPIGRQRVDDHEQRCASNQAFERKAQRTAYVELLVGNEGAVRALAVDTFTSATQCDDAQCGKTKL